MDFDFAEIDTKALAEQGVPLTIKKLDGSPLIARNGQPVRITLRGMDSSHVRAVVREQTRAAMAKRAAAGEAPATAPSDDDFEEAVRRNIEFSAACTASWENVMTPQGEAIPFSVENACKLYDRYPVIREQVEAFIANRANFTRASSKG